MLTILQMYLVQAILYACEILEALEFFFFRMSLRRRVNGIHLEVVAGGNWNWIFKKPMLWNRNGTCKTNTLIIDHVQKKIDLYRPPSNLCKTFVFFLIAHCFRWTWTVMASCLEKSSWLLASNRFEVSGVRFLWWVMVGCVLLDGWVKSLLVIFAIWAGVLSNDLSTFDVYKDDEEFLAFL